MACIQCAKTPKVCGDCGVAKGESHVDGCDVARCTLCGEYQRLTCVHDELDMGWGAVYTGTEFHGTHFAIAALN